MAFLGFMHMKSDALKRLYPRCKKKSGEEKEMNINQQTGLETGFFFYIYMSTHIPQGLNSGAEAKNKEEKSANEMTP